MIQATATTIDLATIAAVVGTVLAIVIAAVTASTAYLRLFVAKTAGDLREAINRSIEAGYARRGDVNDIERRVGVLEERARKRDDELFRERQRIQQQRGE